MWLPFLYLAFFIPVGQVHVRVGLSLLFLLTSVYVGGCACVSRAGPRSVPASPSSFKGRSALGSSLPGIICSSARFLCLSLWSCIPYKWLLPKLKPTFLGRLPCHWTLAESPTWGLHGKQTDTPRERLWVHASGIMASGPSQILGC